MPGGQPPQPFAPLTSRPEIELVSERICRDYQQVITPGASGVVTYPFFAELIRQYRAWKRGIPPSTEWLGRGGQNPRLIRLFDRLEAIDLSRGSAAPPA